MICNPPLKNVLTYLGFADLQSATSSLCFLGLLLGDYKSPGFNRSNLFYGGFQIRRDAWRETFFFDAWRETFFFDAWREKCTLYL